MQIAEQLRSPSAEVETNAKAAIYPANRGFYAVGMDRHS